MCVGESPTKCQPIVTLLNSTSRDIRHCQHSDMSPNNLHINLNSTSQSSLTSSKTSLSVVNPNESPNSIGSFVFGFMVNSKSFNKLTRHTLTCINANFNPKTLSYNCSYSKLFTYLNNSWVQVQRLYTYLLGFCFCFLGKIDQDHTYQDRENIPDHGADLTVELPRVFLFQ